MRKGVARRDGSVLARAEALPSGLGVACFWSGAAKLRAAHAVMLINPTLLGDGSREQQVRRSWTFGTQAPDGLDDPPGAWPSVRRPLRRVRGWSPGACEQLEASIRSHAAFRVLMIGRPPAASMNDLTLVNGLLAR